MPKQLVNGFLVIFDGIDGVGKTTQLQLAQKTLEQEGWPVQARRSLGGTPIGEALREVIKSNIERPTETDLYIAAAIQEALIQDIAKERQEGSLILMDRGPLSLAAYEIFGSGLAENLGWPYVDRGLNELQPELSIIYTANTHQALDRARQKPAESDYFESKPLDYFERVAKGYEAASSRYPKTAIVDANRSIEEIHEETMRLVRQALDTHSSH